MTTTTPAPDLRSPGQDLLWRHAVPAPLRLGPPLRPTPRVSTRRRRSSQVLAAVLALLVLAVVAVVHARGMYTAPLRFDDEGTYVSQARALLLDGDLAPYTYWYDHPPLGWMVITGWLAGPGALWEAPNLIGSGRQLMLVLDVVSAGLLLVLARRLGMSLWAGAAAALLFALSPLALNYHRMVLLDNIATPLLLLALVLALTPQRRLTAAFGSGLAFAGAVLVKETTLLLVPFVLWMLWRTASGPTRRMCVVVFSLGFSLPVLLYPLYALTKGELLPGEDRVSLWEGVTFQLFSRSSSGSVFDRGSDAYQVVSGWLALDPYLLGAAAVLALPALLLPRLRPVAAALLFGLLMVLRPGYLPVPYVVALLPLAALVVAGTADAAVRALATRAAARRGRRGRARTRATRATAAASGLALVALVGGAVLAAQVVGPHWYERDRALMTVDFDEPYDVSTRWLLDRVPPGSVLLVDNVTWTDLVVAGYPQDDLVWFTKPDTDADVTRVVDGYEDVDFVVSTDIMRKAREPGQAGRTLEDSLENSVRVAAFGTGTNEVEVRRIVR